MEVTSAGVVADPTEAICPSALDFLRVKGVPLRTHNSTMITQEQISRSDLILASDEEVRSVITSIEPRSRDRTLTLRWAGLSAVSILAADIPRRAREAATLGMPGISEEVDGEKFFISRPLSGENLPTWLAAELKTVHGVEQDGMGWNIEDAHAGEKDIHKTTLALTSKSAEQVGALLNQLYSCL